MFPSFEPAQMCDCLLEVLVLGWDKLCWVTQEFASQYLKEECSVLVRCSFGAGVTASSQNQDSEHVSLKISECRILWIWWSLHVLPQMTSIPCMDSTGTNEYHETWFRLLWRTHIWCELLHVMQMSGFKWWIFIWRWLESNEFLVCEYAEISPFQQMSKIVKNLNKNCKEPLCKCTRHGLY